MKKNCGNCSKCSFAKVHHPSYIGTKKKYVIYVLYANKQQQAMGKKEENYNNKQNKKLHSSGIILMICGGKLCVFFMRFIPVFRIVIIYFFCIQNKIQKTTQGENTKKKKKIGENFCLISNWNKKRIQKK